VNGSCIPIQQPDAEFLFQLLNLYSEGRLRDVERAGSFGEISQLGYRGESFEMPQVQIHKVRLSLQLQQFTCFRPRVRLLL
jgi:hypothetical protein